MMYLDTCNQWFGCWNSWGFIWVYVGNVILFLICLGIRSALADEAKREAQLYKIKALDYDPDDVDVYTDIVNIDLGSFLRSKSARKQYERWRDGKVNIVAAKKPSDSGSDYATGMVTGMVINQAGHINP